MPTILEIEGQLVRTVERNVVNEVPLAEVLQLLEVRPPVILPSLPRNRTIGIYWDESEAPHKQLNIALAVAPTVRLLPLAPAVMVEGWEPRVALPWTIFVFEVRTDAPTPHGRDWRMNNITFWFSKDEPKGDATDNLIPALLPNVYNTAGICWGDTGVRADQPLNDRIDETINTFYQTIFTHAGDIANNWPYYRPTYKRWARETVEVGAGCYRNWTDWDDDRRTHRTLTEVLGIKTDVSVPIVLPDGIPTIPVNPTFGRAEEWIRGLSNLQRMRLETALANIRADDPNLFLMPRNVAGQVDDEDDD